MALSVVLSFVYATDYAIKKINGFVMKVAMI